MKIQRAYKTKLDLNNKQKSHFVACAGVARFVYNWGLADRKAAFEAGIKSNMYEQKRRFNALKHTQYPWLAEYPYTIAEAAFDHLDKSYQNFFRRVKAGREKAGFPKFKSRHRSPLAFTVRGNISVDSSRIKLPKIGWVRLAESNYVPTSEIKILSANISEKAGDWFVSVQVEQVMPDPPAPVNPPLGIDMGVKSLAVCSDGATFDNPKALGQREARLSRLQRELHRRVKGSNNRGKTKAKIAKLHRKIANTRNHTLENISRYVTAKTKPSVVVLENLNVKGMMSNDRLAKVIADASLGELRRKVEYKAAWHGVEILLADRWYASSKTCSNCSNVKVELSLSERVYNCTACGFSIDRDLNAAVNLAKLAADAAVTACGVGVQ